MSESKPIDAIYSKRDELLAELNQLVTNNGPLPLHAGMSINEAYEAIIACIKHLKGTEVGHGNR